MKAQTEIKKKTQQLLSDAPDFKDLETRSNESARFLGHTTSSIPAGREAAAWRWRASRPRSPGAALPPVPGSPQTHGLERPRCWGGSSPAPVPAPHALPSPASRAQAQGWPGDGLVTGVPQKPSPP